MSIGLLIKVNLRKLAHELRLSGEASSDAPAIGAGITPVTADSGVAAVPGTLFAPGAAIEMVEHQSQAASQSGCQRAKLTFSTKF